MTSTGSSSGSRSNWRGSYLLPLGQGQGGTFGAEPVYVDKQLQVDVSTSYDITRCSRCSAK